MELLTEEMWQGILNNDRSYDGQFFYAVRTTGIFCRPSCKSRAPNKENIELFLNAEQALLAHFRPCKRCKPTGSRLPDEEWVTMVTEYIDRNYKINLTLEHLAEISHGSLYHLHRTFKRVMGVTPIEYIQQKRIEKAMNQLMTTKVTIAEVGISVGLSNTPYFITLFKRRTGYTPDSYRQTQISTMKEVVDNGK